MSPVPRVKLAWKEKKDLTEKMEPQEVREVSGQRVDKVPLERPVLLESPEMTELLETKDPMVWMALMDLLDPLEMPELKV